MFTNREINVPILGIIENMSWFCPEKHPDEIYYIFGKGGGLKMAKEFDTMLLGQIPLVLEIGEAAEKGLPVFSQDDGSVVTAFEQIAEKIISKTNGM
jgi:ATP-binding protein involved in chromosome partitioning